VETFFTDVNFKKKLQHRGIDVELFTELNAKKVQQRGKKKNADKQRK
jgi:hypothetical protein